MQHSAPIHLRRKTLLWHNSKSNSGLLLVRLHKLRNDRLVRWRPLGLLDVTIMTPPQNVLQPKLHGKHSLKDGRRQLVQLHPQPFGFVRRAGTARYGGNKLQQTEEAVSQVLSASDAQASGGYRGLPAIPLRSSWHSEPAASPMIPDRTG
jgi:hypothetical protein